MFKYIVSLLLLVFLFSFAGQAIASTGHKVDEKKKVETDSLSTVNDKRDLVNNNSQKETLNFWKSDEEVEEDSTSNSALSFNFIYYVIEKFKFQVE